MRWRDCAASDHRMRPALDAGDAPPESALRVIPAPPHRFRAMPDGRRNSVSEQRDEGHRILEMRRDQAAGQRFEQCRAATPPTIAPGRLPRPPSIAAENPLKPSTVPWSNEVRVSGVMIDAGERADAGRQPERQRHRHARLDAAQRRRLGLRRHRAHRLAEDGALEEPVRGQHHGQRACRRSRTSADAMRRPQPQHRRAAREARQIDAGSCRAPASPGSCCRSRPRS